MIETITQLGTVLVGISPLFIKLLAVESRVKKLSNHVIGEQNDKKVIGHLSKVQKLMIDEIPDEVNTGALLKSNVFISHIKYCISLDLSDPTSYSIIEKKTWAIHNEDKFILSNHMKENFVNRYYFEHKEDTKRYLEFVKKILLGTENSKKQRFIECSADFMVKFLEDYKNIYFIINKKSDDRNTRKFNKMGIPIES